MKIVSLQRRSRPITTPRRIPRTILTLLLSRIAVIDKASQNTFLNYRRPLMRNPFTVKLARPQPALKQTIIINRNKLRGYTLTDLSLQNRLIPLHIIRLNRVNQSKAEKLLQRCLNKYDCNALCPTLLGLKR